jgi:hypothetical protein
MCCSIWHVHAMLFSAIAWSSVDSIKLSTHPWSQTGIALSPQKRGDGINSFQLILS